LDAMDVGIEAIENKEAWCARRGLGGDDDKRGAWALDVGLGAGARDGVGGTEGA
jgi:hypothetical protein